MILDKTDDKGLNKYMRQFLCKAQIIEKNQDVIFNFFS